jgi:uncharacterized membrane protein YbhN (UPF0104 family)
VRSSLWSWARPAGAVAILAFLLWRLGTGPFFAGLRMIDLPAVTAALALGALTTWCSAWRWSLVARGLGVALPLRAAVAHCYRSVFLNATLPGGVLGDVHRAVTHGRDAGDVGRGIRAVVWERCAGQVVQVGMAVLVLLVLPSPVQGLMPVVAGVGLAGLVAAGLLIRAVLRHGPWITALRGSRFAGRLRRLGFSQLARPVRAARADVRDGLLAGGQWPAIVLASVVIVSGHLATFMIAARTAGATAPLSQLVPLTLLALLAMALPLNVGGWGPREGVAAWAFGAAGLTVAQGVTTAVVYGALVLVASLPGALVLVAPRLGRAWRAMGAQPAGQA